MKSCSCIICVLYVTYLYKHPVFVLTMRYYFLPLWKKIVNIIIKCEHSGFQLTGHWLAETAIFVGQNSKEQILVKVKVFLFLLETSSKTWKMFHIRYFRYLEILWHLTSGLILCLLLLFWMEMVNHSCGTRMKIVLKKSVSHIESNVWDRKLSYDFVCCILNMKKMLNSSCIFLLIFYFFLKSIFR